MFLIIYYYNIIFYLYIIQKTKNTEIHRDTQKYTERHRDTQRYTEIHRDIRQLYTNTLVVM